MSTPHPYKLQWFNDAGKAKVTQTCRVSFSIRSYSDFADCEWYLWKLVHFYWVILGNLIMMLYTMVEVIHTLLCIKERKLLWHL